MIDYNMQNPATILQLKAWQNCNRTPGIEKQWKKIWKKAHCQQIMIVFGEVFKTMSRDKNPENPFLVQLRTGEVIYYDVEIFEKYNTGFWICALINDFLSSEFFSSNKQKKLYKQKFSTCFMLKHRFK